MPLPVSDEIAGAFGAFFHGGTGPSHTKISGVLLRSGYAEGDKYVQGRMDNPNKEERVQQAVRRSLRRPDRAKDLVDGLLTELRLSRCFEADSSDAQRVEALRAAFRRAGYSLSEDGQLLTVGGIDLTTGNRDALDEQIERLRRATDDSAQLLGSAKDLLEAVAKFVLEELGSPVNHTTDFNQLWYLARERLGIRPEDVAAGQPGADQVKKILGASWTIAEQVNQLRNVQGTGHGRTLPTALSAEAALLVVREVCSLGQFVLDTLDRRMGR
jgi:hypothetical protein